MIVTTTPFVPGHRVTEAKGQVFGLVVRSRGLVGNLSAAFRSLAGGEITEYTELLEDTAPAGARPNGGERHADGRQRRDEHAI